MVGGSVAGGARCLQADAVTFTIVGVQRVQRAWETALARDSRLNETKRRNGAGECYGAGLSRDLRRVWLLAAERSARLVVGVRRFLGAVPLRGRHHDHAAGIPGS